MTSRTSTSPHLQHGYWTRAVWLLKALPPDRRTAPAALTRRLWARKVALHASAALDPPACESAAASQQVLPGLSAAVLLAWWADRSGTWRTPSSDTMLMDAGNGILRATGSLSAAHRLLVDFCGARAATIDDAFTEAEIRDAWIGTSAVGGARPTPTS